jgi:hypothetical protein
MPESYEERIDLPNGQTLWYIEEHPSDPRQNHSYWAHNEKKDRKGKRLTGVTTAVKPLDYEKERLMRWVAETQCKGVAQLYLRETGEYIHWLTDPVLMWKRLVDEELTYDQIREAAGDEGTNVHRDAFEGLAQGRPGLDFDAFSDREKMLAAAVSSFFFDHDPKASQVEQVVYSEVLGVAGRLDFAGVLNARCGNHLCACQSIEPKSIGVIDLKTGGFISAAAHAQVGGGYPRLREASGFGKSEWAAILQVFDDGTYSLFEAEGTPEIFERAVATYRDARDISNAASAAWKARETARDLDDQISKAVAA